MQVHQETQYPWDGRIQLRLAVAEERPFTLHLRIPSWCNAWQITVNGAPLRMELVPMNGYIAITRTWRTGDTVELTLEMTVQTVVAHPAVRQMQGRLAIQRGPMVYCLEGVDHPAVQQSGGNLDRITLDAEQVANFAVEHHPDLLGGVTVLRGSGMLIAAQGWDNQTLYRYNQPATSEPIAVVAVPYCTWANRTGSEMRVWFRAS